MIRYLLLDDIQVSYLPVLITKMRTGGISNRSASNLLRKMKEDYLVIKDRNIGGLSTLLLKNITKIPQLVLGLKIGGSK